MCKNCEKKPVIVISTKPFCKSCFFKYFERKFNKTISKFKLIGSNERIGVALSGGKDSLTLLYLLNKLKSKKRFTIEALLIDEGIKGYRDKTIKDAKKFCKEFGVKLNIISFKKEMGFPLDHLVKKLNLKPCSICGVFRRYLINKYSRKLNFDKIATGHNLDDEVQSILMNQFRNNPEVSARLGPLTGIKDNQKFIRRIKPLYLLTEKEITTYAYIRKFNLKFDECPYNTEAYRISVREFINNFEQKYPGTKHAIMKSFLELLPSLKKKYKSKSEIRSCKKCKEPCSQEICQACEIKNKL
tara:strand:+ start:2486 stop:3385 length:900 start_codon:yes stop_codon:yes gene_type:complete